MTHTNGIGTSQLANTLLDRLDRTTQTARQDKTAQTDAAKFTTAQDAASLSGTASILASASASASDDVRADRVAELKAAIASGNYSVPAADVADKLIDSMLG